MYETETQHSGMSWHVDAASVSGGTDNDRRGRFDTTHECFPEHFWHLQKIN